MYNLHKSIINGRAVALDHIGLYICIKWSVWWVYVLIIAFTFLPSCGYWVHWGHLLWGFHGTCDGRLNSVYLDFIATGQQNINYISFFYQYWYQSLYLTCSDCHLTIYIKLQCFLKLNDLYKLNIVLHSALIFDVQCYRCILVEFWCPIM